MQEIESHIPNKKIEKLAKKLAKQLHLSEDEAHEILYKEWDTVERLFDAHGKVKAVLSHLLDEISASQRDS